MAASWEAIFALLLSMVIGVVGYLVRRTVFAEIDQIRKDLKILQDVKVDTNLYTARHADLKEDLQELKDLATLNGQLIQKMVVDLAVVKTKVNGAPESK